MLQGGLDRETRIMTAVLQNNARSAVSSQQYVMIWEEKVNASRRSRYNSRYEDKKPNQNKAGQDR